MHILLTTCIVAAKGLCTLDFTSRYLMLLGRELHRKRTFLLACIFDSDESVLEKTQVLLTRYFPIVMHNVCADLLQPSQGDVLTDTLHLVSKGLSEKLRFRTVTSEAPNRTRKYEVNLGK